MRILALDSSGAACSAALWVDGRIRARRLEIMARGQAERLVPLLLEVMAEGALAFTEIDLYAATTGPGFFTGLRIGLAALRGLALAAAKPMLGITSFEAVAHGTRADERRCRTLLVLLESKRQDLYAQAFGETLLPAGDPGAWLPEGLAATLAGQSLLLAGDAAGRAASALAAAGCDIRHTTAPAHPDAAVVAALAAMRAASASRSPPAPLYLRPPDVTVPGPGLR
ncbi:MAG TPA: tRNA (adenosine(37)-N6)-threonylcarbamoyltransferase complex dimerization subunit type 1 TsaB [Alphaproteobacteria bacterium]|nr:tRNA (adenosine(37)-N6)-threonylcarbamoyltransferase complex dimerization subunit type 1 TsaB [Alphaproteobacteria bacterium]